MGVGRGHDESGDTNAARNVCCRGVASIRARMEASARRLRLGRASTWSFGLFRRICGQNWVLLKEVWAG